ncbi:VanZ family protein [Salinifilum ghardaiensis]
MIAIAPAGSAAVLTAVLVTCLFAPYVAAEHRRHGRLRPGPSLMRAAVLLYATAVACYVLPPEPDAPCRRPRWIPLGRLSPSVTDPVLLQFLCNIALFTPFGAFLALAGHRLPRTAAWAAACSLLVETTQLTGMWGWAPCAHRVFDVDDLLANTLGAALGARLVGALPRRERSGGPTADRAAPRPATPARRLLARCCDLLALWWSGSALLAALALLRDTGAFPPAGSRLAEATALWFAPAALLLVHTACTGGTPGHGAVLLRLRGPAPLARAVVHWATGAGVLAVTQGVAGLVAPAWHAPVLATGHVLHACGLSLRLRTPPRRDHGREGSAGGAALPDPAAGTPRARPRIEPRRGMPAQHALLSVVDARAPQRGER